MGLIEVGTLGTWLADWVWGLLLVTITLVVHAVGIAVIGALLSRRFGGAAAAGQARWSLGRFAAGIAAVTLMLALLHGLEAAIWMAAYLALGAADTARDGLFISLQMITTQGPTEAHLDARWRLMGPLEGIAGMLAFGLSTAFLLAVFQRVSPFSARKGG